jgi:hypothetical protein
MSVKWGLSDGGILWEEKDQKKRDGEGEYVPITLLACLKIE